VFVVFPLSYCLVVNTSAIDCLERFVSEMACYVLSGMLNPTHSLNPNRLSLTLASVSMCKCLFSVGVLCTVTISCWRHYVFRLSIYVSMVVFINYKLFGGISPNRNFNALGDKYEIIRF